MEYENTRSMIISKAKQARLGWLQNRSIMEHNSWDKFKQEVRRFWDSLTPGDKTFAPILLCNLLAFALWRVPAMRGTMLTYFTSNPAARMSRPSTISINYYDIVPYYRNCLLAHVPIYIQPLLSHAYFCQHVCVAQLFKCCRAIHGQGAIYGCLFERRCLLQPDERTLQSGNKTARHVVGRCKFLILSNQ